MYTPKTDTCSNRIAQALSLKGMKPADLCRIANVPKSSLSLYLSGAYEPKQNRVHDIAVALNVSEAWLMGYDVPMERSTEPFSLDSVSKPKRKVAFNLGMFGESTEEQKKLLALYNKIEDKEGLIRFIERLSALSAEQQKFVFDNLLQGQ